MSDTARSSRYEIRVEGVLDPRWTAWFEGLAIARRSFPARSRTRPPCAGC